MSTLESKIAEAARQEIAAAAKKAAEESFSRPSVRLQPKLALVTDSNGGLPKGVRVFTHMGGDYNHLRQYDTRALEAWAATYWEVVAYATTPEGALNEFDHMMKHSSAIEERIERARREE